MGEPLTVTGRDRATGGSARRGLGMLAVALLAAAAVVAVGVAPASAAKHVHRVVAPAPGVPGNGPAQGQFGFNGPRDVAVNRSGVVDGSLGPLGNSVDGYAYVVDQGNHRIQVFDSDGAFQFMFGAGVQDATPIGQVCDRTETPCLTGLAGEVGGAFREPQGVVIDQDSGHVFVRERPQLPQANPRVQEFTAAGQFVRAWGWDVVAGAPTNVFETCHVAAQCARGSTGSGLGQFGSGALGFGGGIDLHAPSGDVIVADPANNRIQRFDVPANPADPIVPVTAFGPFTGFGGAGFAGVHLAVDDDGIVYAPASGSPSNILRYDLDSASFLAPIPLAALTATDPLAETRGLEIDPTTGNLFVARHRFIASGQPIYSPVVELGDPGGPVGSIDHVGTHVLGSGRAWNGLGLDPESGDLYLTSNGLLLAANEGPAAPTSVSFLPYSDVTADSATVNLVVDAGPLLGASYRVQVARSSDPADFETVASGEAPAGLGSVPVAVPLSDLRPGTLYLVRVVSQKLYGNPDVVVDGPPLLTPVPPPSVRDVRATAVEDTSARLVGRVNPQTTNTRYRFEWGQGGFQHVTPLPDGLVGSGFEYVFVSEGLSGLAPSTTYQFRLVATSDSEGATVGDTQTFTTRPAATGVAGRGYELVSPADKVGGAGVGEWYRGPASLATSGFAGYAGERFAAQGSFGSMLLESSFAFGGDWAFADRIDSQRGWVSHSPNVRSNLGPAFASFISLRATSEDLSRFAANSNNTLLQFPELTEPGWAPTWAIPYFFSWGGPDVASRWEFFGPTDPSLIDASTSNVWETVVLSDGGSRAVGVAKMTPTGVAAVRGMAGPRDPTLPAFGELVAGRSVYVADTSGEPSDVFATGPRVLVNVCSGDVGVDRTVLPAVNGSGDMVGVECPGELADRDGRLVSDRGASLHGESGSAAPAEDVVSPDGRRVFFLASDPVAAGVPNGIGEFCTATGQPCPPQLFVRQENGDGSFTTRWISRSKVAGQDADLTGTARFEGATADGDKVLFRTNSPLTADDPNGEGVPAPAGGVKDGGPASNDSWDLYLYDFPDSPSADPGAGTLTRISAGPSGSADCNSPYNGDGSVNTTAAMRFMSDDASRIYFTCAKALVGAASTAESRTSPAAGGLAATETNLYAYDTTLPANGGRWRFIARLPRSVSAGLDACASTGHNPRTALSAGSQTADFELVSPDANCVRGSSDGGLVTLFTSGRLTVDDPIGTATGDVYAFEADSARLTRVSAAQGGVGGSYLCAPQNNPSARCHADGGVDGQLNATAGPANSVLGVATDPLVGGDHVAFFQSAARLLASDVDGSYDVYQWRNGELSLLTPGTADHALYKGNDRDGRNVFFASRERLTWQDFDSVGDVYTARVAGGVAEPPPAAVCDALADLCQALGAVSAPIAPGSGAPGGGGNVNSPAEAARPALSARPPGAAARRRAVRSGIVRLAVRVAEAPVRLRAVASAKVAVPGRRANRRVGTAAKMVRRAGIARIALRLSRQARRELRRGGRLVVRVRVSGGGHRPDSVRFALRRSGR